jgi:hypothetical protein
MMNDESMPVLGTVSDWLGVGVTAALGLAGLYLAHSLERRTQTDLRAKVADKRFASYAALWATMGVASPMRLVTGTGPLRPREREELFESFSSWYYNKGNGMLLSEEVRNIYLTVAVNLICDVARLRPASLASAVGASVDPEAIRGAAAIRQVSLLRTALRADLSLYARPWGQDLTEDDLRFLGSCGVDVTREPWRSSSKSRAK